MVLDAQRDRPVQFGAQLGQDLDRGRDRGARLEGVVRVWVSIVELPGPVRERCGRMQAQAGLTLVDEGVALLQAIHRVETDGGETENAVSAGSTQQLIHRDPQFLAGDIPEGDVDVRPGPGAHLTHYR